MDGTYDVLIIGGGPAGLGAAVTLARQQHTCLILDSGAYRNAKSRHIHTLPTWDHRNPADFRSAGLKDALENYSTCSYQSACISQIRKLEDNSGFEVTDTSASRIWRGRKLILAVGVRDDYPQLDGYSECWGQGIYHCLFCHGYEDRGGAESRAGVLAIQQCASAPHAMHMARNAAQLVGSVTIYTDGNTELFEKVEAAIKAGKSTNFKVDNREIRKIEKASPPSSSQGENGGGGGGGGGVVLTFACGSQEKEAFVAHNPKTHVDSTFSQQLGLELAPNGDLKVQPPFQQTSVRSVFAAGDCQSPFKTAPNAMASGSMAAAGVAAQLQAEAHGQVAMF